MNQEGTTMAMTVTQADALVKQELGEGYYHVKLGGYYYICVGGQTLTPADAGRRKLHLAIADARALLAQKNG
jgi:hypothetical protein